MIGLVRQQCKQVTGSLFLAQSQNEIETNQNVLSTSSLGHITDVLNFKCLPATLFYSTFNYTNQSPGFCCCVSFPTNKHKRAESGRAWKSVPSIFDGGQYANYVEGGRRRRVRRRLFQIEKWMMNEGMACGSPGAELCTTGRMAIDGSCFIHWFELCSGRGWRTASTDNFAICSHLPRWPVQTHKHGNWLAICIFCTSFRGLQPAANYRPTLAPASSRTNWRWRHLTGNFSWPLPLDLIWLLDTRTSS